MFKVRAHEPRPLKWWYEQRDRIDMEPKYQRRSNLWSDTKKAFLIDSILNDYDMPKLYLADFTYFSTKLNEKKKPYAVIDGKQRLQAFYAFFKGDLPLNRNFVYLAEPTLPLAGMTYLDLQLKYPRIAEKVNKHVPAIMSVVTDDDSKIRQLFVRLNIGIAANSAEKRNAMDGIVPDLIRSLANHEFFKSRIKFSVIRMAEFNVAAKLLLIEHRGKFVDTKAANLDGLVREGETGNATKFRESKRKVAEILDTMTGIFKESDPLLSSGGPIPLYYWLVKHNRSAKGSIRPFVERFVKQLQENQKIIKDDPRAGDPELSNYYTMGRTTNDQGSLVGRYKILQKRFRRFKRQKIKRQKIRSSQNGDSTKP